MARAFAFAVTLVCALAAAEPDFEEAWRFFAAADEDNLEAEEDDFSAEAEQSLRLAFAELDVDMDGELSLAELLKGNPAVSMMDERREREKFRDMDVDGSGGLSLHEVEAWEAPEDPEEEQSTMFEEVLSTGEVEPAVPSPYEASFTLLDNAMPMSVATEDSTSMAASTRYSQQLRLDAKRMSNLYESRPSCNEIEGARDPAPGSVLYLVKAWHGSYDTKLAAVMDTWGKTVRPDRLYIIGDQPSAKYPVRAVKECPGDAGWGLACRVGHGLVMAKRAPGNWSWVFVGDDDHFVIPHNVEKMVSLHDATKRSAFGCWGCGKDFHYCKGEGGFCGGCGYIFSRAALDALVGDDEAEFLKEHSLISHSPESDAREDMVSSCLLKARAPDTKIIMPGGMDGWGPPDLGSLQRQGKQTTQLSFHHVPAEYMSTLQYIVTHDPERRR